MYIYIYMYLLPLRHQAEPRRTTIIGLLDLLYIDNICIIFIGYY